MSETTPFPRRSLLLLATGTFAIGTESFMISPLLPAMAADLGVTASLTGQLVTVFALVYCISSPVLAVSTSNVDRRKLLMACLLVFLVGNLVGWLSSSFALLLAARVLMALAAGLYVPMANATASTMVGTAKRGRALAIVSSGQTLAIAIGVPLAAAIGERYGWRSAFLGVAVLSGIGALGLSLRPASGAPPTRQPSLVSRLAMLKLPGLATAFCVTTLWSTGAYTMLTYLGAYLGATLGTTGAALGYFMFVWGASAAVGVLLAGRLTDRWNPTVITSTSLGVLAVAFLLLSLISLTLDRNDALIPIVIGIALWGLSVWGFFPAQQARLIGLAGSENAPVVLSLNASFMYGGFALGAALGGIVLAHAGPSMLGVTAAAAEIGALCATLSSFLFSRRRLAA